MRSGRSVLVVSLVSALIVADVVVASHAGAALADTAAARKPETALLIRPARPHQAPLPGRSGTTRTHLRPAASRVVQTARVRATRIARAVTPISPPVAPATLPGCPGAIAVVVWPPGWQTRCAGPRPGILGVTAPQGTTTLYVRDGESFALLRIVALHEAGHAWDFARLTPPKIADWCAVRGCDPNRFFAGGASGSGWREPHGAEDWAASWDACHGGNYHRSYLGLPPPTSAECTLQNALVGYTG
ncbi:MAG TPA: hypothetical protein VN636_10755 [Acidimicrobiia bacterium]|nr:hypothetical protein [Acidimicrobiia bacterium]